MKPDLYTQMQEASSVLSNFLNGKPEIALVLGTGMDSFSTYLDDLKEITYTDIPYFPKGETQSHQGKIYFGKVGSKEILVLSGRSHYYEGFSAAEVAFPVQVLAHAGIKHIFFTNAAGGVNPHYSEGDIVLINDHINFLPDNPLRGRNDERIGLRFPDMMVTYCPETIQTLTILSQKEKISFKQGVYLAMQGPSLETPAEYKMAFRLGADLVGMSTVPEVIAARHCGLKVTALSIVSNVCYPLQRLTPTTVEEVIQTVKNSSGKLNRILHSYFLLP
ncbi:MAG: purine-nucleoside phosphorylase [Saprospiraceae bacterium]|nr:purine-nucleoside phosphorylase [Saprospiraceae bacterium]